MTSRLLLLLLSLSMTGCAHNRCKTLATLFGCSCVTRREQPEFEDLSLQMPNFTGDLEVEADLDGYTLQAIRIAADDFLDPDPAVVSCRARQASHRYQARREGDVIFVRIDFKPENCGRDIGLLDGGATYAINLGGQILRRSIDGMEPYAPEDESQPPGQLRTPSNAYPAAITGRAP